MIEFLRDRQDGRRVSGDLRHDSRHDMRGASEVVRQKIIEECLEDTHRHRRRNARTENV
ncbi:hypothetical protein HER21_29935 [Pseudomonas sp. BGM005]|nr:hypothetical protein [Pseudomonas sp. BG5]